MILLPFMNLALPPHTLAYCGPYPFSNDGWTMDVLEPLQTLIGDPATDRERSSGVIVGAGGMPFILARVGISQLFSVDLSNHVTSELKGRFATLRQSQSWNDYISRIVAELTEVEDRQDCHNEFMRVIACGMEGDFDQTRQVADSLDCRPVNSNIVTALPVIADQLRTEGRVARFINFTNVASYIRPKDQPRPRVNGRTTLAQTLRVCDMPFSSCAVVVDSSSGNCQPLVMSADEYIDMYA